MGLGRITKFLILCAVIGACAASAAAQQPILPGILRPERPVSGGGSFTVPPTNNGTNDTGGSSPNPIICGSVGSPAGCTNSNFSISAVNDTLVVLVVLNGGPSGTKTITDTCGNTWTAGPSNNGEGDFTYYTSSNCSGADTITVSGTWVSSNYNILFAADFNHQYTGIDATATQSFSGSGATCTGTFNTAVAGELVVGFCDNSGGVTSGGGGMTIVAQGTHNTAAWGDMVQATATSITPTIGHSGGNWWFQILAFKP